MSSFSLNANKIVLISSYFIAADLLNRFSFTRIHVIDLQRKLRLDTSHQPHSNQTWLTMTLQNVNVKSPTISAGTHHPHRG